MIRESGGDRSAVTGGTRVLSDRIVVEITQEPGQSFLDRMIALVEGAERRKTPNEIALEHPPRRADARLRGRRRRAAALRALRAHRRSRSPRSIALLVALIPTTIGALLSAIGIAGMDRLVRRNVLALSGAPSRPRATSTSCCSTRPGRSRSATARPPSSSRCPASTRPSWPRRAQLSSLADETPEGRSIVVLAKQYGLREHALRRPRGAVRARSRRRRG